MPRDVRAYLVFRRRRVYDLESLERRRAVNYCHTCKRQMHYRAMPNHRAAHARRKEVCTITSKQETFEYDYREEQ